MVNYIKSCLLCTRSFRALCDEMGAQHSELVFHSKIHWLAREKILVIAKSLILLDFVIALP